MLTGLAAAQTTSLYGVKTGDGHAGSTGWSWAMNGAVLTNATQSATASVGSDVVGKWGTSASSTLSVDWTVKVFFSGSASPTASIRSGSGYSFTRADKAYAMSDNLAHGAASASVGSASASVDVYIGFDEDAPSWVSTYVTGSFASFPLAYDAGLGAWVSTQVASSSSFTSNAILYGVGYKLDESAGIAMVNVSNFQYNVIVDRP